MVEREFRDAPANLRLAALANGVEAVRYLLEELRRYAVDWLNYS